MVHVPYLEAPASPAAREVSYKEKLTNACFPHVLCRRSSELLLLLLLESFAMPQALAEIYTSTAEDGSVTLSNRRLGQRYAVLVMEPEAIVLHAAHGSQRGDAAAHDGVSWPVHVPGPIAEAIKAAALRFDLDPALLLAVAIVESGLRQHAVSPKGAIGIMQLMPDTALRYGVANSRDPVQNVSGGAAYLRDLLRLFGGDVSLALAGYNAGENAVLRHGRRIPPFAETQRYVERVRTRYAQNQAAAR